MVDGEGSKALHVGMLLTQRWLAGIKLAAPVSLVRAESALQMPHRMGAAVHDMLWPRRI